MKRILQGYEAEVVEDRVQCWHPKSAKEQRDSYDQQ